MRPEAIRCPDCAAPGGTPCYTPVGGQDTQMLHEARLRHLMITDDEGRRAWPVKRPANLEVREITTQEAAEMFGRLPLTPRPRRNDTEAGR